MDAKPEAVLTLRRETRTNKVMIVYPFTLSAFIVSFVIGMIIISTAHEG